MKAAPRPTLKDVAREAGLSVTQASRALNGHSDVAAATKERAAKVAAKIGYAPNLEARRLKAPHVRTGSIGMILSGDTLRFSDPFFGELLAGMVVEAGANKFELQLSTSLEGQDPVLAYKRAVQQKRVDGFVVLRIEMDDPRIHFLRRRSYPFVAFGRLEDAADFPVVDEADDSMQAAVDHLVELGHRQIACVSEPARFGKAAYRLRSFHTAMKTHGLPVLPTDVVEAQFHEESGYECGRLLLESEVRPTAILAFNDLLALGVLRAADDVGVRVPIDLSLVGFDDIDAARLMTPGLTTMRQNAREIGQLLIRQLLPSIEAGSPLGDQLLITPKLVVRDSTAPPPEWTHTR